MYQVLQYQKSGEITVEELPLPLCPAGGILIRNEYSLISAGTEKTSVTSAQTSLLGRARKQPENIRLVLDFIKKEGIASTYNRVMNKLESYKTLGYSTAGIVIESGCPEFAVGDRVAAAGAGYAVHAEFIAVPKNLAVKIPDNVGFDEASFTTLGAIALQGVRQADMRLGEVVAVIGLGLLGQLTIQLLKASGCKVIGLDINESLFERSLANGCEACFPSIKDYIKNINAASGGIGCDAVIITAGTQSNEPLELALSIARKKGKVVVVGAVSMNVPRSPFYEKELDLRISCSYGPGRYDPQYEESGLDYPLPYVRWTENRNMQAFVELLSTKKIDVKSMVTHEFDITDAKSAYDIITGIVNENFLGVLLKYPKREEPQSLRKVFNNEKLAKSNPLQKVRVGLIGAGSFAQAHLIPALKNTDAELTGVSSIVPADAKSAAEKFGFKKFTSDAASLISDSDINMIFCATQHDTHSKFIIETLKAGKPVYIEKPLAVSFEQLEDIDKVILETNGKVMVGFNRRFSKSFNLIKEFFERRSDPMSVSYRVNAGAMPLSSWQYRPEQGAGRLVGEACHFIDCMVFLTGSLPVKIFAQSISTSNINVFAHDNFVLTFQFADGSIGSLQYFANGDSSYPKEYCEVFCEGAIGIMNNFTEVKLIHAGKTKKYNLDGKKGINEEIKATIEAIRKGMQMPIPYKQIRAATLVTLAAKESLAMGVPVEITN
jgi:predicted dehydrogenase/threonine dehydrogenase-like Zn-dependent dehydrogenase